MHRVMRAAPSAVRSLLGIASALAAAAPSSIPVCCEGEGVCARVMMGVSRLCFAGDWSQS